MLVDIFDGFIADFNHAMAFGKFGAMKAIADNLPEGRIVLRFIPVVSPIEMGAGYITGSGT